MKKLLSVFLVVTIISQTLISVGVVLHYQANKAYISQQLCENRNNPMAHCKGHCYLSKQLKKAEEGEQKQSRNILKEKDEIISCTTKTAPAKYYPAFSAIIYTPHQENKPPTDCTGSLLKPPTA
ncbi:MAG TPA: hypothetical protein VK154_13745 [Chitinophagales bacterium]|nr:hypothetical protein [Chitinophagales bacterium]